jgi:hypothetical protein
LARPIAHGLAALAGVDAVCVFSEPTPIGLIKANRADVLVNGGDYSIDTVVGAREAQSWGGQVKIVPIVPVFSATRCIARARVMRAATNLESIGPISQRARYNYGMVLPTQGKQPQRRICCFRGQPA